MNKHAPPSRLTPYEADYARWCAEQGALLRDGGLSDLDRANLAEEIESLGRSDRKEIGKRLRVLLLHLLKWKYQPGKRKNGWKATILVQRNEIQRTLTESPSMKGYPHQILNQEYEVARLRALSETGLAEATIPQACPFSIEQLLDGAFFPDGE